MRVKHIYLMGKRYDEESLCDLERDISEVFDPDYNPHAALLPPTDEHGFRKGFYTVDIVYHEDT